MRSLISFFIPHAVNLSLTMQPLITDLLKIKKKKKAFYWGVPGLRKHIVH